MSSAEKWIILWDCYHRVLSDWDTEIHWKMLPKIAEIDTSWTWKWDPHRLSGSSGFMHKHMA